VASTELKPPCYSEDGDIFVRSGRFNASRDALMTIVE
jgi:hypothetical protein